MGQRRRARRSAGGGRGGGEAPPFEYFGGHSLPYPGASNNSRTPGSMN